MRKVPIIYLSFYLKTLEKEEKNKIKASRRKEIVNMITEIYEIGNVNIIEKINETKS